MKLQNLICYLFLIVSSCSFQHSGIDYPETPKGNVIDTYFGNSVSDPYRWLEDDNAEEVKKWVTEQNSVTNDYLSKIPFRDKIRKRLETIWNYPKYTAPYKSGNKYFFYKNDGLQNQYVLYVKEGWDGEPSVFLDPNKLSDDGTRALSSWEISNDNKYFAYGISEAGSDWKEYFVIDIETGKQLDDHIKWIKFSGVSWLKDGFFYSRFDEPIENDKLKGANEFQKVFYHKLGTSQDKDELIYKDDINPRLGHYVEATEDERYLILYKQEGAGSNNALFAKDLKSNDKEFKPVIDNFEKSYAVISTLENYLIVKTNYNAPRQRVVLIDPHYSDEKNWIEIIPEQEDVLESVKHMAGKLILIYMKDASNVVYSYELKKEGNSFSALNKKEMPLPTLGSVSGFNGKTTDSLTFYTFDSFVYPSVICEFNVKTNFSQCYRRSEIDFNPEDYTTKQVFYESKDGTKIPMFIVYKNGLKLDGNNPTLLYGYGGFDISLTPSFSISNIILLENGGVYAMPNLRGGGEYGEKWHNGGMQFNKQNVFDDFISAAEYLVKEKYTSSEKLAIHGGSNGGLLVAACMTQRPTLFKVALPAVGVLDMLRFHKFTIGHAWVPEYGSSDDSSHFQNLIKYSPLHNVKANVNYPATLVSTADHDDRVVPAHSFKFISELQKKHDGPNPVLIRIETRAGHGAGKPVSKIIEEQADKWAFIFYNLDCKINYNN